MCRIKLINAFFGLFFQFQTLQKTIRILCQNKKNWEKEFDEALKEIEFPVKLSDFSKFPKKKNPTSLYCFTNGNIAPLDVKKEENERHRFILL